MERSPILEDRRKASAIKGLCEALSRLSWNGISSASQHVHVELCDLHGQRIKLAIRLDRNPLGSLRLFLLVSLGRGESERLCR